MLTLYDLHCLINQSVALLMLKEEAQRIVKRQREIFLRTNKFGSPVDLDVYTDNHNVLIAPAGLGKHFGVLRALKILEVMPKDKLIAMLLVTETRT